MKVQSLEFKNGLAMLPMGEVEFTDGIAKVSDEVGIFLISKGGYTIAPDHPVHWSKAKRILFVREEGIGDVLLCTPVIRTIKQYNPKANIDFLTRKILVDVLMGVPYINKIYSKEDFPIDEIKQYECNINDNYMEFRKSGQSAIEHRVHVFASAIPDLPRIDSLKLDYCVDNSEADWARTIVQAFSGGKPVVVVPLHANCVNRILPRERLKKIVDSLSERLKVILVDNTQCDWQGNNILNLCTKTTIRQMAAIVQQSDLLLTPDTGVLHIAAALDKPVVAYFGAIDWRLRITHDKLFPITGDVSCYPCNGYECSTAECIKAISNDSIIERVFSVLGM